MNITTKCIGTAFLVSGALLLGGTSSAAAGSCTSVYNANGSESVDITCGGVLRGAKLMFHIPDGVVGQDGTIGISLHNGTQMYAFGIKANGTLDATCIVNDTTAGPSGSSNWIFYGYHSFACDMTSTYRVYNYW